MKDQRRGTRTEACSYGPFPPRPSASNLRVLCVKDWPSSPQREQRFQSPVEDQIISRTGSRIDNHNSERNAGTIFAPFLHRFSQIFLADHSVPSTYKKNCTTDFHHHKPQTQRAPMVDI